MQENWLFEEEEGNATRMFVLEILKPQEKDIPKPDGAMDSHEREIKCLGLSFIFKANSASLL